MGNGGAYDKLMEEYMQVCTQYEAATQDMVALAENSECRADEFKVASNKVAELAERLGSLRAAMAPLYAYQDGEPPPDC